MILKLNLAKPGFYTIKAIDPWSVRLQEIGFLTNRTIYIFANNALGIQVRINNAVYLLNEVIASTIYVESIEE
jgi:Fe2+ transport system protein FeoA